MNSILKRQSFEGFKKKAPESQELENIFLYVLPWSGPAGRICGRSRC